MLFADDIILTSFYVRGFQTQIDTLKQFAEKFWMSVNLSKTKIIIFRNGGFLGASEKWWFNKALNRYKYLGMHFSTKLSLTQTVSELASATKASTNSKCACNKGKGENGTNTPVSVETGTCK